MSWILVGLVAGFGAFLALKAFNLLFVDPNHPLTTSDPLLQSDVFVFFPRDIARLALVGAVIAAPLAAWGRRGTASENWQALFVGLVLGAISGAITDLAASYLFAPDAVKTYSGWFASDSSSLSGVEDTLKWIIRFPWAVIWAVFGVFTGWFVGTQTHARRVLAAVTAGVLCAAVGAGTLELVWSVDDIDGDLWTALLGTAMGLAVAIAVAVSVRPIADATGPAAIAAEGGVGIGG
jgi:hypothetical protein